MTCCGRGLPRAYGRIPLLRIRGCCDGARHAGARRLPGRARCIGSPAEHDGPDRADNLLLHDLVLVDRDMSDPRYALHVDILQRAPEVLGPRDRLASTARDVEVDIALGVPCQP